jgi:hypothetical protein
MVVHRLISSQVGNRNSHSTWWKLSIRSVVDQHRFDADPFSDPTFHFDADPDPYPDPTPSFSHMFTAVPVYIVLTF